MMLVVMMIALLSRCFRSVLLIFLQKKKNPRWRSLGAHSPHIHARTNSSLALKFQNTRASWLLVPITAWLFARAVHVAPTAKSHCDAGGGVATATATEVYLCSP